MRKERRFDVGELDLHKLRLHREDFRSPANQIWAINQVEFCEVNPADECTRRCHGGETPGFACYFDAIAAEELRRGICRDANQAEQPSTPVAGSVVAKLHGE